MTEDSNGWTVILTALCIGLMACGVVLAIKLDEKEAFKSHCENTLKGEFIVEAGSNDFICYRTRLRLH